MYKTAFFCTAEISLSLLIIAFISSDVSQYVIYNCASQ